MRTRLFALACGCLVLAGLSAAAQPPASQASPEHQLLKKFAGDWDATVAIMGKESHATSHNRVTLGGLWLVTEFKGEFLGAPFEGKGATGYDPVKKKYVSTWIDSMTPSLLVLEGTFDKETNTYTEIGEMRGPDGKPTKTKSIYQFPDDDTMVFTMYSVVEGKDQEAFKITYKRKK
jgi:hypothetical protein